MKFIPSMVCLLLVVASIASGCAGGNMPAASQSGNSTITDGVMTTAVDNTTSRPIAEIKTTFPADVPVVYCSFKVNGVAREDMIKATWIYIGGAAQDKVNTQLNETYDIVQAPESSYYLAFYLDKPVEGWYKGDYNVVLSINNKEKLSVPFKIE